MFDSSLPVWDASWIWGAGEQSPRNEWRCFRKCFVPEGAVEHALLRITADSRYILYVNGIQIGRGPVRSWPFELAYDEYEVNHLLQPGVENVIAVLVMHFGVSTFQYLRGRGGLLVELKAPRLSIVSNEAWKTTKHNGYRDRSSRISCQLAFTEVYDASAWDESWILADYEDVDWDSAIVIGEVGMKPWTKLIERGIPHLTEEPIFPSHVHGLSSVQRPAWSVAIDLFGLMDAFTANHANGLHYCGFLAAKVHIDRDASLTIGSVDSGLTTFNIIIDGQWVEEDTYFGELPERFLTVELTKGEHLLLIDVSGSIHGHAFHLGIDSDAPFHLTSLDSSPTVPFSRIGPFEAFVAIDHQPSPILQKDHSDYLAIRKISSANQLQSFKQWIHAIEEKFINPDSVFTNCVWHTARKSYPVSSAMQFAADARGHGFQVPQYEGMDTEIVFDFGRELSGYLEITLDTSEGTVVDAYGMEYIQDDWRQHTYGVDNTFRYTCRTGKQTYRSAVRRGLRYVALTIKCKGKPVTIYEIKMMQSNYPVVNIGQFGSDDSLLNDIWHISRETTRLCMEDTFVDCPTYEQAFWVGDARNEALINYYTFGVRDIVERSLKLVPGSAFQSPLYVDQVPSGWNSVIPNWTFFWITACLEYYEYSGKRSFIHEIWPSIKLTLHHYLKLLNDQGLMERTGWNLLDWAQFEQPNAGIITPQNMFLVKALREASVIAIMENDHEQAIAFDTSASQLTDAINKWLWDEKKEAYVDCIHPDGTPSKTTSIQTHIVSYLCHIADDRQKKIIENYLVNPPADFVQVGSPFMAFFYYEALAQLGRLDIMLADIRRNYGFMIKHGATACWEMYPWSGYVANPKMLTRSHCHAWSAAPGYFLGAYILGVKGTTPGWSKVTITPSPCDLQWVKGSVPLPHQGQIDVTWKVVGPQELHLHVEAPAHVEVSTQPPTGWTMKVERVFT